MTYRVNELTFELPEELKDKSVNIFSLTDDGPSEFGIVITRVPLNAGEDLASYTARQVAEMQSKMPAFVLLVQAERRVQKQPAMFLEFIWKSTAGPMHQRQLSFVASTAGQPVVLMMTATCKDRFSPAWDLAFQSVMDSVQFSHI